MFHSALAGPTRAEPLGSGSGAAPQRASGTEGELGSRPRFKMLSAASRQRREDRRSDRPASDSSGNLRPEAQRVRLMTVSSEYGPKRLRPSGPGPKGRIPY